MRQVRRAKRVRIIALVGVMLIATSEAHTQARSTSPLLASLGTGTHEVGFQSFWKRDGTRTWAPAFDESGRMMTSSPLRPVRINVWYPAAKTSGPPMRFNDYVGSATTTGFEADEKRVRRDDLGDSTKGLRGLFKSKKAFDDLMETQTIAHRDAAPSPGKFPIVVYSLGQGDYTQENTPFCEYLASMGFVVVSVPGLGTSPRRMQMFVHDPPSYDNQVRDMAFALSTVIDRFPSADRNKIAAMGHSMGGVYALMLAMRYSVIRTVVGLDPSFMAGRPSYFYKYQEAPDYDAGNFPSHLLAIHKSDDDDRAVVDSLRFADRTLITVDSAVHADFNGFPVYTARASAADVDSFAMNRRSQHTAVSTYDAVMRFTACYLAQQLRHPAGNAAVDCNKIPRSSTVRINALAGPTEEELYDIMKRDGIDNARQLVRNLIMSGRPIGLRRPAMQKIINELGYLNRSAEAASYESLMKMVFVSK